MYFSFHGKIWKRSMCDCSLLHFIVHLHISKLSFSQWICLFSHIKTLLLRLSLSLIFFPGLFFCRCRGLSRRTTAVTGGAGWEKRGDKRYFSARMDWWTDGGQDGWEEGERDRERERMRTQWALQRRELSIVPFAYDAALPRWRVSMVTRAWRLAGLPNRQTCCQCHQGC